MAGPVLDSQKARYGFHLLASSIALMKQFAAMTDLFAMLWIVSVDAKSPTFSNESTKISFAKSSLMERSRIENSSGGQVHLSLRFF